MSKLFSVALAILTAIGGFVDIGDLVTNAVVGSRFGPALVWVVVVGVVGICLYANGVTYQSFVVMLVCIVVGALLFTGVDPIMVTEYSVVFSAVALPLTYLPILIVANDSQYMGDNTNVTVTNMLASVYLVIILAASLAAIPLIVVTGAGQ